jgi:hypothetical protein
VKNLKVRIWAADHNGTLNLISRHLVAILAAVVLSLVIPTIMKILLSLSDELPTPMGSKVLQFRITAARTSSDVFANGSGIDVCCGYVIDCIVEQALQVTII